MTQPKHKTKKLGDTEVKDCNMALNYQGGLEEMKRVPTAYCGDNCGIKDIWTAYMVL